MECRCAIAVTLALWTLTLDAHAATAHYPPHPVRLIVPFPPGGGSISATEITARANADGYTLLESDVRGVDVESWYVRVAPAATPRDVIALLNSEVARIAATADYRALLEKNAFDILTSKPEEFPVFVRAEREQWNKVIKAAGIRMQ